MKNFLKIVYKKIYQVDQVLMGKLFQIIPYCLSKYIFNRVIQLKVG